MENNKVNNRIHLAFIAILFIGLGVIGALLRSGI